MLVHWIWLATRPEIGDRLRAQLLETFSDAEDIYFGSEESYAQIAGMTPKAVASLMDKELSAAEKILQKCADKQIRVCTWADEAYPKRLRNIPDPPVVLYYKGNLPDMEDIPVISVVGTRKSSMYGNNMAQRFGYQIVKCGALLVSGAADGIDGMAMQGALLAGGTAVGVLGTGVDIVYPARNRQLFEDIQRHGCLISEFPPETPAYRGNFPRRNRIISGLANGTVIIEAPEKSGALITARQALEQGRDVFVVPANVDMPGFQGSHGLLRDGAIPVRDGWDVVGEYASMYPGKVRPAVDGTTEIQPKNAQKVAQKPLSPANKRPKPETKEKKPIDNGTAPIYSDTKELPADLTQNQRCITKLLEKPCLVDELIAQSGLSAGQVAVELTLLEIRGVIRRLPGNRVSLK